MKFKEANDRGFMLGEFNDKYNQNCSLQESSAADEHCVWLGVNDGTSDLGSRMHLTQEMAADLLGPLAHFVATGVLPRSED